MSAIRVAVQSNVASAERIAATLAEAEAIRAEAGCLQFELFKGIEFPEDVVQLELWESEAAYDRHWQRVLEAPAKGGILADGPGRLAAPHHHGMPHAPRREGLSGVEIYPYARFSRSPGDVWVRADEAARIESVRWPVWSAVRIAIQLNMPVEGEAAAIKNSLTTRAEPGCLQFEHFRSVQFPENTLLMELWRDPEIYDIHYLHRIEERMFDGVAPPAPRPPTARRYGQVGFEWYQHAFFNQIEGTWQPENARERMVTVRW